MSEKIRKHANNIKDEADAILDETESKTKSGETRGDPAVYLSEA